MRSEAVNERSISLCKQQQFGPCTCQLLESLWHMARCHLASAFVYYPNSCHVSRVYDWESWHTITPWSMMPTSKSCMHSLQANIQTKLHCALHMHGCANKSHVLTQGWWYKADLIVLFEASDVIDPKAWHSFTVCTYGWNSCHHCHYKILACIKSKTKYTWWCLSNSIPSVDKIKKHDTWHHNKSWVIGRTPLIGVKTSRLTL